LVLDREYTGLVFGLDARIHVYVKPLVTDSGESPQEIVVRSPQFKDAIWEYGYRYREEPGVLEVSQLTR
jgi:phosphomevalonate kinase